MQFYPAGLELRQIEEVADQFRGAGDRRYVTAVGRGRVTFRMQIDDTAGNQAKPMCATELTMSSSDVPDFLRRRL